MAPVLRVRLNFRDHLLQYPLPQGETGIRETSVLLTLRLPVAFRARTDPFLFLALDTGRVLLEPVLPLLRSFIAPRHITSRGESKKGVDKSVRGREECRPEAC